MLCSFCSTHKLILPPLLKNIIYFKTVKINAQFGFLIYKDLEDSVVVGIVCIAIIYLSHASIRPSLPPRGYSRGSKEYISVSFLHIHSAVQIGTDYYPIHLYGTVFP